MSAGAGDQEPFVSYSATKADVILRRLFAQRPRGFFVDVGPGEAQFGNDLYGLYRAGWSGINVEQDAARVSVLRDLRPRDHTVQGWLGDGTGPDPTLSGLLDEWAIRSLDVLRVDVGAATEAVLGGGDWERFRPHVLLLVAHDPRTGARIPPATRGFLEQRGYRHVLFDGVNDFYLEHGVEAPEGFTLPANPFDRYVPAETRQLRDRVAKLQVELAGQVDQVAALSRSLDAAIAQQDEAKGAVRHLADENRHLSGEGRQLEAENRRLRSTADRQGTELAVLGRLLEPLHTMSDQMDRQRRSFEAEGERLRDELRRQQNRAEEEHRRREIDLRATLQRRDREQQVALQQRELQAEVERRQSALDHEVALQRREAELQAVQATLASVYHSSSWRLTKAWRGSGRLLGRVVRRLGR